MTEPVDILDRLGDSAYDLEETIDDAWQEITDLRADRADFINEAAKNAYLHITEQHAWHKPDTVEHTTKQPAEEDGDPPSRAHR